MSTIYEKVQDGQHRANEIVSTAIKVADELRSDKTMLEAFLQTLKTEIQKLKI